MCCVLSVRVRGIVGERGGEEVRGERPALDGVRDVFVLGCQAHCTMHSICIKLH